MEYFTKTDLREGMKVKAMLPTGQRRYLEGLYITEINIKYIIATNNLKNK